MTGVSGTVRPIVDLFIQLANSERLANSEFAQRSQPTRRFLAVRSSNTPVIGSPLCFSGLVSIRIGGNSQA